MTYHQSTKDERVARYFCSSRNISCILHSLFDSPTCKQCVCVCVFFSEKFHFYTYIILSIVGIWEVFHCLFKAAPSVGSVFPQENEETNMVVSYSGMRPRGEGQEAGRQKPCMDAEIKGA